MIPAILLSFLSGAIALSYEILWYRAFSFASGGRADTFGLMLGSYLLGLALGSLGVRRDCRGEGDDGARDRAVGRLLVLTILANALGYLVVPAFAWMMSAGLPWKGGLPLVGLAAGGLGAIFPLVAHAWIPPDLDVGRRVAAVYLANILGSVSGSLGVGFVLMDHLSLGGMHVLLLVSGLGMAAILAGLGPRRARLPALGAIGLLLALGASLGRRPFDTVYERLQEKTDFRPDRRFVHVLETKSGVITVNQNGQVFGGGVYDGAFNTTLTHDKNSILRCYALAELKTAPKDVLMIGLSSGSWGTVIADHPAVERFTIIEINPGYLKLIPLYSEVAGLLSNPKVEIEIDDGRRWMVRHEDRKFDLIVANATFHWRSNSSNLLSREFLQLVRSRLRPGGLYYYNTTGSQRVIRTACSVFPYALRVGSFIAVSDSPLALDVDRLRTRLFAYPRAGGVVLDPRRPEDVRQMDVVLGSLRKMVIPREHLLPPGYSGSVITDDNMGTEFEDHWDLYE